MRPRVHAEHGFQWHNTPYLRFLSIADFEEFCRQQGFTIHQQIALDTEADSRVVDDPNLNADVAVMVLSSCDQRGKIRQNRAIGIRGLPIGDMCARTRPCGRTHRQIGGRGCRSAIFQEPRVMQIKVYVPKVIEIPSEYLPALAKRAADSLGERSHEVSATRGHLVRQAVQDGLLREFDPLIGEDGTVDLVCDPGIEIPLEFENRTLSLAELLDALQYKRNLADVQAQLRGGLIAAARPLSNSPAPGGLSAQGHRRLCVGCGLRACKGTIRIPIQNCADLAYIQQLGRPIRSAYRLRFRKRAAAQFRIGIRISWSFECRTDFLIRPVFGDGLGNPSYKFAQVIVVQALTVIPHVSFNPPKRASAGSAPA